MFEEGVQYEHVKNLKPETKPYYQALIDKRDIPYVVSVYTVGWGRVISVTVSLSALILRPLHF